MVAGIKTNTKENWLNFDSFVRKFSGETKQQYVYEEITTKKSFIDKSVQSLASNSIIEGYFPKENLVKDMAIKRINKTLCIILSVLIMVVVVSYYFVISYEMKLNDISRQTVILNNENEELQNKLDSLKSFNNVDKTLQQNNLLQRPGQVIETLEIQGSNDSHEKSTAKKRIFNNALGF